MPSGHGEQPPILTELVEIAGAGRSTQKGRAGRLCLERKTAHLGGLDLFPFSSSLLKNIIYFKSRMTPVFLLPAAEIPYASARAPVPTVSSFSISAADIGLKK